MIVPILLYGSQMLRRNTSDVVEEDKPGEISRNMFETLKRAEGIGLAGPQVAISKKIFIIDTTPMHGGDPHFKGVEKVFLNPQIVEIEEEEVDFNEGCLSIPGIFSELQRPDKIYVKYQNLAFETVEEELQGLEARIFQHEYDHLDGILFIDHMSGLQKRLIQGKLKKIKKRR